MCLEKRIGLSRLFKRTTLKFYKGNPNKIIGWKVIKINTKKKPRPPFVGVRKSFKVQEWINEYDYRTDKGRDEILSDNNQYYSTGFHIMTTLPDAINFVKVFSGCHFNLKIIKVVCNRDSIVAYGRQSNSSVMVSEDMYIPKQRVRNGKTGELTDLEIGI